MLLCHSFILLTDSIVKYLKFSKEISERYNQECNLSSDQCVDCLCKNFEIGFGYSKKKNMTVEQVYENIYIDLEAHTDISSGLVNIKSEMSKAWSKQNISNFLDSKSYQWTFLEKIDALLRYVPKVFLQMPMDFDTSIMEQVQSSNLYPFLTQKDMDHLFQFFSLPDNEVNIMAISHLYTLNDYKQLGKSESFSFLSDPSSYLAGVPEEFQECFRKIYENNVNSKYGQDEEYFPLPKQMPLIVSPCYNISMTHPCKSYCKWHETLIDGIMMNKKEFLALMRLSQPQGKLLMEPMNDVERNLTKKIFGNIKLGEKNLQSIASMPLVIFCKDRIDQKWNGDDIGLTPKFCSDFYPIPTDQGICQTKNLDFEDLIKFSPEFKESFRGKKIQKPALIEGDRLRSRASFLIYTNSESGFTKTYSRSTADRKDEMKTIQMQIHSQKELPRFLKDSRLDLELDSMTMFKGYEYTIELTPFGQSITDEARAINSKERGCLLPDEIPPMSALKLYARDNCLFECQVNYAVKNCYCIPWDFSLNVTGRFEECDIFGRTCFMNALRKFVTIKENPCPQCVDACEFVRYPKTKITEKGNKFIFDFLDPLTNQCKLTKDFCEYFQDLNGTIEHKTWYQQLTNLTASSGKIERFLLDHIVVHIIFTSGKMEMDVLDVRYTFYDRLSKLGGTLGLCSQITGASFLTMIHLFVLFIKAIWRLKTPLRSD